MILNKLNNLQVWWLLSSQCTTWYNQKQDQSKLVRSSRLQLGIQLQNVFSCQILNSFITKHTTALKDYHHPSCSQEQHNTKNVNQARCEYSIPCSKEYWFHHKKLTFPPWLWFISCLKTAMKFHIANHTNYITKLDAWCFN